MAHRSSRSMCVGVVGELRQLAGRGERVGADERGRADLLEGVGVAVEAELAQRPQQAWRPQPAVHREHRAGDLHRPLDVEDAELRSPISQCGHPLVVARRRRRSKPAPLTTGLSASLAPVGRRRRAAGWGCAAAGRAARPLDLGRPRRPAPLLGSPRARLSAMPRPRPRRPRPRRRSCPTCFESSLTRPRELVALGRDRAHAGRRAPRRRRARTGLDALARQGSSTPSSSVRSRRTSITATRVALGAIARPAIAGHGGSSPTGRR